MKKPILKQIAVELCAFAIVMALHVPVVWGASHKLHYQPADSVSVICLDGNSRFNRAIYGAHSGFRMECSDMPEFGIYLPGMGGNFLLRLPEGTCEARYTPGRMDYLQGGVRVEAQVMRSEDAALWRVTNTTGKRVDIPVRFGGVSGRRFSREGDLGVDAPDCFAFKPEYCKGNVYTVSGHDIYVEYGTKSRASVHLVLPAEEIVVDSFPSVRGILSLPPYQSRVIALFPPGSPLGVEQDMNGLCERAEAERLDLVSSFSVSTPDPWLNPVAGALAVAADGIWSGQAWLHGSIGWRTPHLGWRGAYAGDALGRHDRALTHFKTYAANQITDIPASYTHPRQDSVLNLARAEKKWGTPMYSNGYICRRPGKKNEMSHYDMNMVYIDAMLRHFRHTGDTAAMRQLFPVVKRHLAWEKLNFDPDGDHLYDAYCCIWASDALYYNGGAVTHSSAYNRFANALAAQVAAKIGEDPSPYIAEAEAIGKAIDSVLWMPDRGYWAEFKDLGGSERLHPAAALWTLYHAIDSEIDNNFKNYAATVYIDRDIPHIPVEVEGLEPLYTLSTTNWKPYSWSINNVAIAEVMHTALAYWQAGRPDDAYVLMKGVMADNMYSGTSPLNFGQISQFDAARGECYRDFADPIGVWSRALTEGLFGIRPDMIAPRPVVDIIPGFPSGWMYASVSLPQFSYSFSRDSVSDRYAFRSSYPDGTALRFTVPASGFNGAYVNGLPVSWSVAHNSIGCPRIVIEICDIPSGMIVVRRDASSADYPTGRIHREGPVEYSEMASGLITWWKPEVKGDTLIPLVAGLSSLMSPGFMNVISDKCVTVDLSGNYNASVTDIFQNRYLSPRPQVTTLQIPAQGIGEWCHPKEMAEIDDSGLRSILAVSDDRLDTSLGVPLHMPSQGKNVIYTSRWDNYPDSVSLALEGSATNIYLAMAGSTNHMQWGIPNGVVRVTYTDGRVQETPLINPVNWAPVEQDFFTDPYAFAQPQNAPLPMRLHLETGRVGRTLGDDVGLPISEVYGRRIPGGAGVLLDIPVDPERELASLSLVTLSHDVVIGIMGITLQKP